MSLSSGPDYTPGQPAGPQPAAPESIVPETAGGESGGPEPGTKAAPRSWQSRLLGICFAIFALEIGLFLVIFPWMDDTWDVNYFQTAIPALQNLWSDPYFRGALTGLGLVNIYIACQEVIRVFRKA